MKTFQEKNFQYDILIPFFCDHKPKGLNWLKGKSSQIDPARWIVRDDLISFLKTGNAENKSAYEKVFHSQSYKSDIAFFEAFWSAVLEPRLTTAPNAATLLSGSLPFCGQSFSLWNEAPYAGAPEQSQELMDNNLMRIVPEATFHRFFPQTNSQINIRCDLAFFVNGLFFSYAELKTTQTNQSAAIDGRLKIASDIVGAATRAIAEAHARHPSWPGFKSEHLLEAERHRIRQDLALYFKSTHIVSVDMGQVWILSGNDWVLEDVDAALMKNGGGIVALRDTIVAKVIASFSLMPHLRTKNGFEEVLSHLSSLYDPVHGVDREILFYNQIRSSRTSTKTEIFRPRPAQRTMIDQTLREVEERYREEQTPKINSEYIRNRLHQGMPNLGSDRIEEIVRETLLYRNGADAHTILLQGAAGLGKTNVIVWLAQALSSMPDFRSEKMAPLFDKVILLTDRTELRKNIAQEADRTKQRKPVFFEAKTFDGLKTNLANGTRVVVVNIQKFPALDKFLNTDQELENLLSSKRVAFLIDEVHRSQNGELHDATMDIFRQWSSMSHDKNSNKRNLIIGLTATPRDDVLARMGEWREPAAPGDDIRWVPFYAYTMQQAIDDKVILNPLQNILEYSDHLQINGVETMSGAGNIKKPAIQDIYEDPTRQRLIAKQSALVFVAKTMRSIPVPRRKMGEGKAMFAASSIKTAIQYQRLIKEELDLLAMDDRFKEHADHIRGTPVLLLFSDTQGFEKCSTFNNGKKQDDIIDEFRRKAIGELPVEQQFRNAIIVVVDKLLTGFDEPTLHTIFIDRGMNDVLLFQSACRIDRIQKNKTDCLIVDFSHEGSVSKALPSVFSKYGGLTVSDFDAMSLRTKMVETFKYFFKNPVISTLWTLWKNNSSAISDVNLSIKMTNDLKHLSQSQPDLARTLYQHGSSWLSCCKTLSIVLNFSDPIFSQHSDENRQAFASQCTNDLHALLVSSDQSASVSFHVDLVKEIDAWGLEKFEAAAQEKTSKSLSRQAGTPISASAILNGPDLLTLLSEMQLAEDQKIELMDKIKDFLKILFSAIDLEDKKTNNSPYKKLVLAMINKGQDFPWEERYLGFVSILNSACISPKIARNPLCMALIGPMTKRKELIHADYEEWIRTSGNSIF